MERERRRREREKKSKGGEERRESRGQGREREGSGSRKKSEKKKGGKTRGESLAKATNTLSPLPNCETLSEREREFRSQLSLYALGLKSSKNCFDEENSK